MKVSIKEKERRAAIKESHRRSAAAAKEKRKRKAAKLFKDSALWPVIKPNPRPAPAEFRGAQEHALRRRAKSYSDYHPDMRASVKRHRANVGKYLVERKPGRKRPAGHGAIHPSAHAKSRTR